MARARIAMKAETNLPQQAGRSDFSDGTGQCSKKYALEQHDSNGGPWRICNLPPFRLFNRRTLRWRPPFRIDLKNLATGES